MIQESFRNDSGTVPVLVCACGSGNREQGIEGTRIEGTTPSLLSEFISRKTTREVAK